MKSEGTKHDTDKPRWDLLPYDAVAGTVSVLTFGANKYADRNWENGLEYGRIYGALMRHMTAWWGGEDLDPESGLLHLDHAACCIAFLQAFVKRGRIDLDNRPVIPGAQTRILASMEAPPTLVSDSEPHPPRHIETAKETLRRYAANANAAEA